MSDLAITPFSEAQAHLPSGWRYPPPFDIYDGNPNGADIFVSLSAEGYGYYAVVDRDNDDELVGYCCFGPEARVAGQAEEPGTLDVGGAIRPDLVSQGLATALVPSILAFATAKFAPTRFRTAVASFNDRSLRLCRTAGFEVVRHFEGPGRQFQELAKSTS